MNYNTTIKLQPNLSSLTAEDLLHSRSRSHFDLIRFSTAYIVSRRTHEKHIRYAGMDMYEPHRKHIFLYRY
jgi:hypothetical protein